MMASEVSEINDNPDSSRSIFQGNTQSVPIIKDGLLESYYKQRSIERNIRKSRTVKKEACQSDGSDLEIKGNSSKGNKHPESSQEKDVSKMTSRGQNETINWLLYGAESPLLSAHPSLSPRFKQKHSLNKTLSGHPVVSDELQRQSSDEKV